jgi:ankyrin repeat protein
MVKEFGGDMNLARHDGLTPLMVASLHKHASLVKQIIKEGADTQALLRKDGIYSTAAFLS